MLVLKNEKLKEEMEVQFRYGNVKFTYILDFNKAFYNKHISIIDLNLNII